jgi:hypothetical protein
LQTHLPSGVGDLAKLASSLQVVHTVVLEQTEHPIIWPEHYAHEVLTKIHPSRQMHFPPKATGLKLD